MDFSSPSSSSGDRVSKNQLTNEVCDQVATATAQEVLQKVTQKCYFKCVEFPGPGLRSQEKTCLQWCVDRYFDSWSLVSCAYNSRLQKENNSNGGH